MPDLAELLRDPARAVELSSAERQQLMQQLAALSLILATVPAPQNGAQPDRARTAEQVAERLALSKQWVRENADTDLKSVTVRFGGAVRYSERGLEELIRRRRGA